MFSPFMMMNPMTIMNPFMMMNQGVGYANAMFPLQYRNIGNAGGDNYAAIGKSLGDSVQRGDGFGIVKALFSGVAAGWGISAQNQTLDAMQNWRGLLFPSPSFTNITITNPNGTPR